MHRFACLLAVSAFACGEYARKPTFPEDAAQNPSVLEQALLGISQNGDAAAAQLFDVEGRAPELALLVFDHKGGATRPLEHAPIAVARAVSSELRKRGRAPLPLLAPIVAAQWPQVLAMARDLGFAPVAPAVPDPGRKRYAFTGAAEGGALPLQLRIGESSEPSRSTLLLLGERPGGAPGGDELELARMPIAGTAVEPQLFIARSTAWLVAGSTAGGANALTGPLRRAVGLRVAPLLRAEAELHNAHGLADYGAGDLDSAAREFDRALAADPGFVDALYNAASTAALTDRDAAALAFLRRAAAADPARVQVLGRDDDDLRVLRKRADVRALLGLKRPPPE